ncbi:stage II sporulation protein M [Paenibacillus sp. NPDC058071]|uniref:stage II sporulation protein M n=1 Tax=Paenibacillus sp. NPDC058071 TaxID=3346326 RepID=UPI0036D9E552
MFKRREIMNHFKLMRPYTAFAVILFLAGIVIGGSNPAFSNYLEQQLSALGGIANSLQSKDNPTLAFILFIFFNNAIKSVFVIYIGALFGVIPLFFLLVNGMVIGFLLKHVAETGGAGEVWTVIVGLVPHGIIEIPAIIVACAYGLKFGVLMWKMILAAILPTRKVSDAAAQIETFLVRSVPVAIIIVVGLLVASVIESTFSIWLMNWIRTL